MSENYLTRFVRQYSRFGQEERTTILKEAHVILMKQGCNAAEGHLLKLLHRYDLCHETTYDLLIAFQGNLEYSGQGKYWIQEQTTRMYHRAKMETSTMTKNVCTMLNALPQALDRKLPQVDILSTFWQHSQQLSRLQTAVRAKFNSTR